MKRDFFVILFILLAGIFAVYGQTASFDFTVYDDDDYVYANPIVKNGITAHSVSAAFTQEHAANWHPVTWLSHMLDVELFGLDAGAHHLSNVILHGVNAVLLFLMLFLFSNSLWPAALVAFLFAFHPLHVESVAWISERKDVLSFLFGMLTFLAYGHAVVRKDRMAMVGAIVFFGLSLMSKPMLVTLPLLLFALDYWPLGRLSDRKTFAHLVLEKLPFVILAVGSAIVTLWAQGRGGAIQSVEQYPLVVRLANAVVAYGQYLVKMVLPINLAVIYPHQGSNLPLWQVGVSGLCMIAVSCLVWLQRRKQPWLLVGWFWYVVTLLPVIGIIQVGYQAIADRYTYIPLLGPFMMIAYSAWNFAENSKKVTYRMVMLLGCALVVILSLVSHRQVSYWHDSFSLFGRALVVTNNNFVAHNHLGIAYLNEGKYNQAAMHFQKTIGIKPDHYAAYSNRGIAKLRQKNWKGAEEDFRKSLEIKGDFGPALTNLGLALYFQKRYLEAVAVLQKSIAQSPDDPIVHDNIGGALMEVNKVKEAAVHFERAVALDPSFAGAHYDLGMALFRLGNRDRAIEEFKRTLVLEPKYRAAKEMLARVRGE